MYTIPHYLPHETKTGLFRLPYRRLGVVALVTLGMTFLISAGEPAPASMFFMSVSAMLAGAEFLPARLWQARGWLRVASIVGLGLTLSLYWASQPAPPPVKQEGVCVLGL
jgi:hypothetical protein